MSFDPNAPIFSPPDAAEERPTHPQGTFGQQGECEIIACEMSWYHDKQRHKWEERPAEDAVPFIYIGVTTSHPDLGPVNVYTGAFGDYNTAVKSKSGKLNKSMEFLTNLGLAGKPPAEFPALVGRKVQIDVKNETRQGKVRANLAGIWLR